jgi:hypothetical protein
MSIDAFAQSNYSDFAAALKSNTLHLTPKEIQALQSACKGHTH